MTPTPGQSVTAAEIDSLVIPVDQVMGVGDSLNREYIDAPEDQPKQYPPDPAGPCHFAHSAPDDVALFGRDTLAFRSVRYSGFSNVYVVQAIGVYPDNAAAQSVFAKAVTDLNSCKATNPHGITISTVTPSAVTWQTTSVSRRSSGESRSFTCGREGRVVKNVVFRTEACIFNDSPQIAASVADQISAKINNPA